MSQYFWTLSIIKNSNMQQLWTRFNLWVEAGARSLRPLFLAIALAVLVALPARATGVYQMPDLGAGDSTWVVDEAEVISRVNEGKLSSILGKLAEQGDKEVRMVAIRRLDFGETIESFTNDLFQRWFPTPAARANQMLVVLDTLTNNVAIRAGEAVQDVITDEVGQSLVDDNIGIALRDGNKYNEALLSTSDRLIAIFSGQPDPGPPIERDRLDVEGTFTKAEESDTTSSTVWVIGFLIVATVVPMLTYFAYVGFPGR